MAHNGGMLIGCLLLLFAYLIGSVSGSLVLGRLRGVDIRTQGSGNAGGTNAFRTQGAKFALGVVLVDIGKGALAAWLALRFAPLDGPLSPRALGFLAAFAGARVLRALLFGISETDLLTLAASAAFFTALGAVAGILPARRAARINPVLALRAE